MSGLRVKARTGTGVETLTRDDYAEAGLALLAEGGIGGVTIATTCARLGVTKGSFYHHFRNGREFHDAMLEYWEHLHGSIRPSAIDGLPPLERLEAQLVAAQERDHEVESAIRAWSRSDEAAAIVQRRLDDLRLGFTMATFEACGVPRAATACSRARPHRPCDPRRLPEPRPARRPTGAASDRGVPLVDRRRHR